MRISIIDDPVKLRKQCQNWNSWEEGLAKENLGKSCDALASLNNLTFPELREVTDYVALYQTKAITTLSTLFPNLAVIRGNQLIKVSQ